MMLQGNLHWKLGTFLVVVAFSGLAMGVLGLAKWGVWGGLGGGRVGLLMPYKILARKRKRRLQKF